MRRIFILMAVFAITAGATAQLNVLSSNGNVGIGNSNPQSKLSIKTGNAFTLAFGSAEFSTLYHGTSYIGFNATRNNSNGNWTLVGDGAHNGGSVIWNTVNGHIYFATVPSSSGGSKILTDTQISDNIKFQITPNGNVGIGTDPTYKLDVRGTLRFSPNADTWRAIKIDINNQWNVPQIYSNDFMIGNSNTPVNLMYVNWLHVTNKSTLASDETLKENIKPLNNMLSKVLEVEGKRYNYKQDTTSKGIPELEELLEKETFGFIAQELERVFPELVDPPSAVNNYYSINYIGMIPVLVEAIKEQQTQIERLQAQIDGCCKKDTEEPTKGAPANENNNVPDVETAKLFQNIPNPFSANTEIRFEIPENSTTAKLLIHDMQGGEIKSYTITAKGAGAIMVQGHELPAGMYLYTLLVNNAIIDTKKMILTK